MKKGFNFVLVFFTVFCFFSCHSFKVHSSYEEVRARNIPNLNGYITLLCDFHIHTVYSDGNVGPTVRVEEAYYENLDAIAITDHVEHRIWRKYRSTSLNTSYEIAITSPRANDVIVIRGSEITRAMPPGHFNTIFLNNCDQLAQEHYIDAFLAAKSQNAFFIWNHPGWRKQLKDGAPFWWPEHTNLLERGMLHGIEVANGGSYFPAAHQWALEHNLTMIGGTDVHKRLKNSSSRNYRTMTLVFARERTAQSIHEALMARRTAVYFKNRIIGEEKYLRELFEKSVKISVEKENDNLLITFTNNSDFIFYFLSDENNPRLLYLNRFNFKMIPLLPNNAQFYTAKINENFNGEINFTIDNLLVGPGTKMRYTLKI